MLICQGILDVYYFNPTCKSKFYHKVEFNHSNTIGIIYLFICILLGIMAISLLEIVVGKSK